MAMLRVFGLFRLLAAAVCQRTHGCSFDSLIDEKLVPMASKRQRGQERKKEYQCSKLDPASASAAERANQLTMQQQWTRSLSVSILIPVYR